MVVVRENSEGLYSGAGGFHRKGTEHEVAVQESINTRHGVERIVRYAFELAMRPDRRRKLTLVHKTNVLTFAGDLYQRVVNEVAAEFPDVETDYVHVDACCIYFLDQPSRFDVIVTDNMFGDIITDLGAMIQGGMGIAAGRQHQPGRRQHVRADRRHRARPRGQGHDQPARRDRCGADAARAARRGRARPRASRRASGSRARRWRRCGRARWAMPRPRSATWWWSGRRHDARSTLARRKVELYDTTLRDGAQQTGLSYSIEDRLRILHKIDQLGVPFIEGGWPGANPRDTEFFKLATKETLQHAALTSFGMTRKAGEGAEDSAVLRELLDTGTEVVCIVGKASDAPRHRGAADGPATRASRWCATRSRSCARRDRRVFFDAEHFFDGYRSDATFAMRRAAGRRGGGRRAAGAVRHERRDAAGARSRASSREVVAGRSQTPLGIHVHNDAGCAVANSLIAVENGAFQVQGVVNGYGERTGNADLIPIAANLVLKMDADCLPEGAERATHRGRAFRGRGGEPRPGLAPAVRRPVRVHAQGRAARERRRPAGGGVRARAPYVGREPARHRRERPRRRGHAADEGRGVRGGASRAAPSVAS